MSGKTGFVLAGGWHKPPPVFSFSSRMPELHIGDFAYQDKIVYRRMRVARLRLRGLTYCEISLKLFEEGLANDEGNPFSDSTIGEDMAAIEKVWRESTQADLEDHKARVFAEIQEVKRVCWSHEEPDTDGILRAIKQERALLGIDEVKTVNLMVGVHESLEDKLEAFAEKLQSDDDDGDQEP